MDTTDAEIIFDNEGNCNHCNTYLLQKPFVSYMGKVDDGRLKQIVFEIKKNGKGKKYDCIIGISGGADGCYSAYTCKNLGLKALLVHMDNGWNSIIAVENIKHVADTLGFDYESYVLDWEEFRDLQLSFLKASVPEIETPTDIAILGCLHKAAAKHGIKHIIMGCNYISEGILPKSWHYDAKDKKYITSIHAQFGKVRLKTFPFFDFWTEAYHKVIKKTSIVYLLNYIRYDRKEAIEILKKMGWKDYEEKHHESHYTKLVQAYILPTKFNIDYRKVFLSIAICNGNIIKYNALEILNKPSFNIKNIEQEINYVCKKLGITTTEFETIMALPVKTHRHYPNNKKIITFIYKAYLYLFKKN